MPPRRYSNEERQEVVGLILDAGWTAKATAEHLGINARSVATWANAERAVRRGREWTEQVKPHFGFLEAYGFAVAMDPGG
jgi:transposase-like protein